MQKTIFMVDDNVTNLAKAEEALDNHYLVITLSSAAKMFTVLEKIKPDLILLDIDMPEMDGLEAIKVIKANKKYFDIPVIFLTGFTDSDTEAYGIELGAVDFITKPFSEPVLLNRIKNHLSVADIIHERTVKIESLQNILVRHISEGSDDERVQRYIKLLTYDMQAQGIYSGDDAKIQAIAEVYAALTHEGPFRLTDEEALEIIMQDESKYLDSKISQIFCDTKTRLKTNN